LNPHRAVSGRTTPRCKKILTTPLPFGLIMLVAKLRPVTLVSVRRVLKSLFHRTVVINEQVINKQHRKDKN